NPQTDGHVLTLASPLAKRLLQTIDPAASVLIVPPIYAVAGARNPSGLSIDTAFELLQAEYQANQAHRAVLIEALLTAILVWLSRNGLHPSTDSNPESHRSRHHFQHFNDLIENCYTQQLTVDEYARQLGITAAHLNSL